MVKNYHRDRSDRDVLLARHTSEARTKVKNFFYTLCILAIGIFLAWLLIVDPIKEGSNAFVKRSKKIDSLNSIVASQTIQLTELANSANYFKSQAEIHRTNVLAAQKQTEFYKSKLAQSELNFNLKRMFSGPTTSQLIGLDSAYTEVKNNCDSVIQSQNNEITELTNTADNLARANDKLDSAFKTSQLQVSELQEGDRLHKIEEQRLQDALKQKKRKNFLQRVVNTLKDIAKIGVGFAAGKLL